MRANRRTSRNNPTASNKVIPTGGEILDDGTILELVEDLSEPGGLALIKYDGRRLVTSPRIVHRGETYRPLPLDPSVRCALRLPSGCAPSGSTTQLFARLLAVFENFTDLVDHARKSLVAFLFAVWIADLLPVPVTLFLWAPDPVAGARVLSILSSLCRLALPLSGADARDLTAVPENLPATLLLFLPASSRRSLESLAALGWRGFRTCRRGRLVEIVAAKAIASTTPFPAGTALGPAFVIHVPTTGHPLSPLDKKTLDSLAKDLLPELPRYDAVVGRSAPTSSANSPGSLLSAFEVCFGDVPALNETLSPLIEAGQNGNETDSIDLRVPLLEVLRGRCHEPGRDRLYVGEIALDLNAKIIASGGKEITDRMVGGLLRSLGMVTRKLDRHGRGLTLDGPTRLQIHRLAQEYNAAKAFAGCLECTQTEAPATNGFANE